jgi:hypothetical protein
MMTKKTDLIALLVIAICLAPMILPNVCKADPSQRESLITKYASLGLKMWAFGQIGADDAYYRWTDENSKWPIYNKDTWHFWSWSGRFSMVGASILDGFYWHPQQSLLSPRSVVYGLGTVFICTWTHNRFCRLVQTGQMFPPEKGHGFFLKWKWINLEIKSSDELQWGMFSAGIVLLTIDACWNKIFPKD